MKKLLFLLTLFVLSSSIFSQKIEIIVSNSNNQTAALHHVEGEKTFFVDSVKSRGDGYYLFNLQFPENHHGLYRLKLSNRHWIDFIFDGMDIELKTDINNILENFEVKSSESNKLFYSYIGLTKEYKTKAELLQLMLARYPKGDDYYLTTQNKLKQIQNDYLKFVNKTSQSNPKLFISRYIKSSQLPAVGRSGSIEAQLEFLKLHALDNVDFDDAGLIYSDAFANKSIEYLTYYRNQQLPKGLLEQEFMKAIDSILYRAKVNQLVYQHLTEYLIDGFKKFGFDAVIDYVVENYVIKDDLCLDEKLESSIERRIDQSRLFKIGNSVPEIVLPDSSGNNINLSDIKADKILILYYASWCTHCQDVIPELHKLYKYQREKNVEVLAISLDTERSDWLDFVKSNELSWLDVSDLKGWDGKAASDYYIYATPTMFLLDKDRNIISTSILVDDYKRWFRN